MGGCVHHHLLPGAWPACVGCVTWGRHFTRLLSGTWMQRLLVLLGAAVRTAHQLWGQLDQGHSGVIPSTIHDLGQFGLAAIMDAAQ